MNEKCYFYTIGTADYDSSCTQMWQHRKQFSNSDLRRIVAEVIAEVVAQHEAYPITYLHEALDCHKLMREAMNARGFFMVWSEADLVFHSSLRLDRTPPHDSEPEIVAFWKRIRNRLNTLQVSISRVMRRYSRQRRRRRRREKRQNETNEG